MTDKEKEQEKARSEGQLSFERRVQREMLAVGKKTSKMASAKYAGGVDLDNLQNAKGETLGDAEPLMEGGKKPIKKKGGKK